MIDKLEAYVRMIETDGKIFSVKFIKKDGSLRKMICRLGVKKNLTGEGLKFDPIKKRLLPVFDMRKNDYRMINLAGIKSIKAQGVKALVV